MYTVSIKTAVHVKVKRSWTYEHVEATNGREAGKKVIGWACEWWDCEPRDVVVVSVDEE